MPKETVEEETEIPLSDMDSAPDIEKEDLIPRQKLTIYNNAALTKAYKTLVSVDSRAFSVTQAVNSASQTEIEDVNDDLGRELAFYKQSLDAAIEAHKLLSKEGVPFTRPKDYFAEMVKSDEHMDKIKSKMVEEAANKKAAADARKQRDLKKFGKQVQVAKLQERDRAKRQTLDKINQLKRRRKDTDLTNPVEDDVFDIALEKESGAKTRRQRRSDKAGAAPNVRRQKKDKKFGFGGKKRFAKSGDAMSSGDLSAFSTRKMKSRQVTTKRLGKSRRKKGL